MVNVKKSALLMLHWQNSVANPKGVWGKALYPQVRKNDSIKNAKKVLAAARKKGMMVIYVNIGWRPGFPEVPAKQYYPLIADAKKQKKGILGSWDVKVINSLKPKKDEITVINYGSDGFESTDLDLILRSNNIEHIYVSGQCIEHVVATTVKRAANMGYEATIMKDSMSGFTDSNYKAMLDILPLYCKVTTSDGFVKSLKKR